MFFKAIMFFVLTLTVITLLKRGKTKKVDASPTTQTIGDDAMKRCVQCGVHLPESDALQYQTLYFCCN